MVKVRILGEGSWADSSLSTLVFSRVGFKPVQGPASKNPIEDGHGEEYRVF